MGLKNSSNKSVDESNGLISEVSSAAQKTTNYQAIDCYVTSAIAAAIADQTVGNTTSETTLIGTLIGGLTLPANFLTAGKTIKIKASGYITNTGTPTLRIKAYLGATTVLDTTAFTMGAITGTQMWTFEGAITCRTTGGTGTVSAQGEFRYYTAAGTVAGADAVNTSTVTIDTTGTLLIDLKATWGTGTGLDTLTCTNFICEVSV